MTPSVPEPTPPPAEDSPETGPEPGAPNQRLPNPRSASRLAAVQALYQVELGGGAPGDVFAEFLDFHHGAALAGPDLAPADREFFQVLAHGTSDQMEEVDRLLAAALKNHTVGRLDAILRAVLRVGTYELIGLKEIPARVVICEYLDLAHAFFSGSEPKLVNGVLDHIAQSLRPDEFK